MATLEKPASTMPPAPPAATGRKSKSDVGKPVRRLPYDGERVKKIIIEASKKAPEQFRPYIAGAAPVIAIIGEVVAAMVPLFEMAYDKFQVGWKLLEPYHPEDLLPMIFGLLLAFFGGTFLLTIAATEAFLATSYPTSKGHFFILYDNYIKARDKNKEDNQKDDNKDGIADVDQIDAGQLLWRKVDVALRAVEPGQLQEALGGLYVGFLAIVAALRLQFARAIALGASIGDIISKPAIRVLSPPLTSLTSPPYRKWVDPLLVLAIKLIAVNVAWLLQRIISTVHSAIRGGQLCARGGLAYFRKLGFIKIDHTDTYLDEVVATVIALLGFGFQLRAGWGLPFPLNILFLPLRLWEGFLAYYVAK